MLADLFTRLNHIGLRYAVLRADSALNASSEDCEIDLLVSDGDLSRFEAEITRLHFAPLPSFGHFPHSFYMIYDGRWIKLDVVTELLYGQATPALRAHDAHDVLSRRIVRDDEVFTLGEADEFVHLLLHCLLDKERIELRHRRRLRELSVMFANRAPLAEEVRALLHDVVGKAVALDLIELARTSRWDAMLATRQDIARHLAAQHPIGTAARTAVGQLARRLRPLKLAGHGRGMAIALLGPDGSGKTTLTQQLERSLPIRVRRVYMGYGAQQDEARGITRWLQSVGSAPRPTRSTLARKGLGVARFVARLLLQVGRTGVVAVHRTLGRTVVLDRHVLETPAVALEANGGARLRRRILTALAPAPDLVFLLDAPATVLHERKPEHSLERIDSMRREYRALLTQFPKAVVVDVNHQLDQVSGVITREIWDMYVARAAAHGRAS